MTVSHLWIQTLGTLASLALLEAVLSADNAVAIAALVRDLEPANLRERALNLGLVAAFALRVLMISLAMWVVRFPQAQLIGGGYLIWLAARYFREQLGGSEEGPVTSRPAGLPLPAVVALVGVTDLAFSLDSVTAAIAVTDRLWLVVIGGAMGVVMLRFLAGRVLLWMERFVNLQNAAYLTVLAVGLRLVARQVVPALAPSEPMVLLMMAVFFLWGFSRQQEAQAGEALALDQPPAVEVSSAMGVWITPTCTSTNTTRV
jgi:YkoY family integral membrane protein